MPYQYKDRKVVCIVSDGLASWQAMNVVGHLVISLGAHKDSDLMGRDVLFDGSTIPHAGIARYGLVIKKGNSHTMREALELARENGDIAHFDFPREMLDTAHDDELADSLLKKKEKDFEYLGILLYGPSSEIHMITKKLSVVGMNRKNVFPFEDRVFKT